jgi:hypothetical protein
VSALIWHQGGCHCRRVRFGVLAPAIVEVEDCNCSICAMFGFLHLIVPAERFRLLRGAESLHTYMFNTNTAKHLFCTNCGTKSFYVPRSHPDGYSVNVRCIDPGTIETMNVHPIDGRDWENAFPGGRGDYR